MYSRVIGNQLIAAAGGAQTFEAGVQAYGPLHFWRFSEISGIYPNFGSSSIEAYAGDAHTTNNPMMEFGIPSDRGILATGASDEAVLLQGDASIIPATGDFTLWFLLIISATENPVNGNQNIIVEQRTDANDGFAFGYQPNTDRLRLDWVDNTSSVVSGSFVPTLSLPAVESLFLRRDATNIEVYRAGEHGTPISQTAHGGASIIQEPTSFMNRNTASSTGLLGELSEVAFWNSALTEAAMDGLYALTGLS